MSFNEYFFFPKMTLSSLWAGDTRESEGKKFTARTNPLTH